MDSIELTWTKQITVITINAALMTILKDFPNERYWKMCNAFYKFIRRLMITVWLLEGNWIIYNESFKI